MTWQAQQARHHPRTLALLEGRSPEEVALARIARGIPLAFSTSFGEDPRVLSALDAAMFDGPADLAERSGEELSGEGSSR